MCYYDQEVKEKGDFESDFHIFLLYACVCVKFAIICWTFVL